MAAVFCGAALGQAFRRSLHHRQLNQIALAFLAASVALGGYLVVGGALDHLLDTDTWRSDAGLVSTILFLVPGFPLMTAALDLARLDLLSGTTRMVYAALLTFAAGFGLWFVTSIAVLDPLPPDPIELAAWSRVGLHAVASFVAVFGFAMVFNSPPRVAATAGVIGLIANPLRLLLLTHDVVSAQIAAAVGTLVVGLLAWLVERTIGLPRIILSVPTVVIMVPGVAAFRALVAFEENEVLVALDLGITATTIAIGMATGLVAARMLTDPRWSFATPNPPSYSAVVRRLAPYVRPPSVRRRRRPGD
jgi:uncharacterized membrane protein YjjB (DUF3815 family)